MANDPRPGHRPALADLHTHTVASDGDLSPSELVRLAAGRRLAVLALTDHDTLAGLDEAARAAEAHPEMTFVPGIEVSAALAGSSIHILGLGIDPASAELHDLADRLLAARNARNPRMLAKLGELGIEISMDELRAIAGVNRPGSAATVVSRVHIARALVQKGHASCVEQAFGRYIGKGRPAYVEKDTLAPAEVAGAIRAAGGLAVLAHAVHMNFDNYAQLERLLRGLKADGVGGIEAYHSDHNAEMTRQCLKLAGKLDLAVTGGSDYHGHAKPDVGLGRPRVPVSVLPKRIGRIELP